MKVLGMALMPFVALAAKALPDGQQYFGRIRDNTPIVTNGYTRMQIDARACHVLESANTYTDAATNAAHKSAVGMVSAARGYADGATNAVAKTLRGEIGDATNGLLRAESDPTFAAWKKANSVAAGQSASAAQLATAVGPLAKATELSSAAFGYNARANGVRSLALGYGARTTNEQSVAIGYGAVSHGINTFSVNAESPSAFYLGGNTLQSFLDLYAKSAELANVAKSGAYADLTGRPTIPTVPTKVSAFQNDAGYVTKTVTNGLLRAESDPTVPAWAKAASKPAYTASEVGAATPADVTAAIREQSLGGIWDEALLVWWTPRMRNGSLTYEATTNVNLNAEN